ncbi:MAG: hypothetical protein H7X78_08930 [Methyloceanibacter sp.]|jgi:hypothetical protein|nr:hypothetical protein [Methyloceanibacter sp.]
MPRFVLAFVLCCCVPQGATVIGAGALAASSELSLCLDASTTLGAGGDVSDEALKSAQSACTRLKQSSPDQKTLARVKAAAETIDEEVQRRQASGR